MTLALSLAPLFAAGHDGRGFAGLGRAVRGSAVADPAAAESERALVARVRAGDAEAFRTVMEEHFPHAVRFAMSVVHDRAVAEDAAQDVFVRIWETHAAWMPVVSVRAYVLGAVRHRVLNVIRHQRVEANYRGHGIPFEAAPGVAEQLEHSADVAALHRAIAALPERRRMAVAMRYEHELSHAEIGEALGVSPKAAKELIARTLEALYLQLRKNSRKK